ncbi:MAG: ATP-binding cassette domain-containing protein, partial [Promethearchaeota archaeon]
IISIATNDVDQLTMVFGGQLSLVIADAFRGLLIIILMLVMNWELALLSFLVIPTFLIFMKVLQKKAKSAFKVSRKAISEVTQKAEENISGMKVIQAYGKQSSAAREFDEANVKNQQATMKIRKIFAYYIPIIFFVMGIFSSLVLLYGGSAIVDGVSLFGNTISLGTLNAMSNYLMQLFMPIMSIAMFQQFAEGALAASERIYKLLNEKSEIPDSKEPVEFSDVKGEIQFKNVTFQYSERETKNEIDVDDHLPESMPKERREQLKHLQQLPEDVRKETLRKIPEQQRMNFSKMLHLMKETSEISAKKITKAKKEREHKKIRHKMSEMNDELMQSRRESMQKMMNDPENILKLSLELEKQLRGEKGSSLSSGDGEMGGGGGSGGGGGMLSKIPRSQMLTILSSDKVSDDIFEQFSPIVKQLIKEHKEIEEHKLSKGEIIKDVSFTIPAGKTIAIVGPTGAGKTTLIKLIARFYDIKDDSGEILIDGINIKDIRKEDLRISIGMVPQDSYLFTNTILENLYYGKPEGEEIVMTEELMEISKFLGLDNFIQNMPEKYNTPLMENASNLSVGQRQLIAFARVLMVNPKILILDEATSSVDPYTETLIQDALNKAKKGRTTIIIAHRLSTIKNADEIYVLEDGKFAEHGSHEELMALNGQYANLVAMQAHN